jgi:hypothetical protein
MTRDQVSALQALQERGAVGAAEGAGALTGAALGCAGGLIGCSAGVGIAADTVDFSSEAFEATLLNQTRLAIPKK